MRANIYTDSDFGGGGLETELGFVANTGNAPAASGTSAVETPVASNSTGANPAALATAAGDAAHQVVNHITDGLRGVPGVVWLVLAGVAVLYFMRHKKGGSRNGRRKGKVSKGDGGEVRD